MQTLVKGIREWYGDEALTFLNIRNTIEAVLISKGFIYYHGSLVSKRAVSENCVDFLGPDFLTNLINFQINDSDLIIAPESTIRVYDYLLRHKEAQKREGEIFYSQEFMRNEKQEDIEQGKTFTFWQTGFEIYGKKESSILAIKTVEDCLNEICIPNIYFRISDKRILEGFLLDYPIGKRRSIYKLIDKCNENAQEFYQCFQNNGGNKDLAKTISSLLDINNIDFELNDFESILKNDHSLKGFNSLKELHINLQSFLKYPIYPIPFMPKSWDACDSFLFDARIDGYDYAVAGGGNLVAFNSEKQIIRSGAGIGVTRLTEYIINKSRQQ